MADDSHAIAYGDAGQSCAISERLIADACHAVSLSIIRNGGRDNDISRVTIIIRVCHRGGSRLCIKVVVDTVHLAVVGTGGQGCCRAEGEQQEFCI